MNNDDILVIKSLLNSIRSRLNTLEQILDEKPGDLYGVMGVPYVMPQTPNADFGD
jgi:hypothetical protein